MALDRQTVVATAIQLIDQDGLDALTLRKLAAELGVQAPALYWHFKNKRELLDVVADALLSEQRESGTIQPAGGQGWTEWLTERLRANRRALLGHRDSARIVAGNRPSPEMVPNAEALLATLVDYGLTPGEALLFVLATGNYLSGSVLEVQTEESRSAETEEAFVSLMTDATRFPTTAAAVHMLADGNLDESVFDFGLQLMVEGLEARLARRASGQP